MALIGLKQLDSPLTGSLKVSGSGELTGSLTVGGTLFGPVDDHFDIKSDKDVRLYLDKDNDGSFHKFQVFNEDGDVKFAIASDGKSAIGAAVTSTSLDGLSVTGGITATGHITGSGNISGSATSTGLFGNLRVESSILTINNGSVSGSATSTGSFGRVEANGVVYADSFESVTGGTTIDFNDDVSLIGNLTASAHISASGNITGSDIYSSGRIYEAGSSVIDHATAMAIVFGG